MKKRFVGVFTLIVIVVSFFSVTSASAGANATIKGPKEVYAGETYTYTYTASFSSCTDGNAKVSVDGIFEIESGVNTIIHNVSGSSYGGTYSESITVRVKSDAQPGQTGKIIVKVDYQEIIDEEFNLSSDKLEKTFTATVAAKPAAKKPKGDTDKPSETAEPEALTEPAETPLEPSEQEILVNSINALTPGSVLVLPAEQAACLPRAALLALKQNGAALKVDFGHYTCTIDGSHIGELPEDFAQIDLSVSMAKEPSLSTAAGGFDEYQLHFAFSGDLPCRLIYSFPAAGHNPGETLYLYYYYKLSDVIEGKRYAVVDENGYVSFDIYHCSSYFITSQLIDNAAGVLNTPAQNDVPTEIDDAVQAAMLRAKALESPTVTLTELTLITLCGIVIATLITAFACKKVWSSRS